MNMKLQFQKAELHISFFFAVGVALMLVLDDSGTAAMTLAACLVHECGHLLFLLLFGEYPQRVSLAVFGVRIDRARGLKLSFVQEALVALAGPLLNLLLAACSFMLLQRGNENMRIPFYVNLGIAVFNLLPIEPLDGSRVLFYLFCLRKEEETAKRGATLFSTILVVPLIVMGVLVLIKSGYNFTLLAVSAYLFLLLWFKQ